MHNDASFDSRNLSSELEKIANLVHDTANVCQGDVIAILGLLRQLENLHREIRDQVFQESLPDNRQALYGLLKDIESCGGWPYIERMRLQSFLVKLEQHPSETTS